jgi:hypothetical protein
LGTLRLCGRPNHLYRLAEQRDVDSVIV